MTSSTSLTQLSTDYVYCSSDDDNEVIVNTEVVQPQDPALFDEECSGEIDREYTGQFEGPEKTLEVCFRRKDGLAEVMEPGKRAGLRTLTRLELDAVCNKARCTILSQISNQYLDAYVLSESSLFVYNYMIIIKTCGTTTLLRCLALIIELGRRRGLDLDWVGYSRKNFNFPGDQQFPHGSFMQGKSSGHQIFTIAYGNFSF